MLKVTTLFIAAAAALGMSSASASTYPNKTRAEAQAFWNNALNNGWTTSNYGNVQRYGYNPGPTSLPPVASSGDNYTTIKRMGDGFTLEQKTYANVPGRDLAHPVALRKPITHASMAKAFAKTLPILGNALALKELFDQLYGDSATTWDSSQQSYARPTQAYSSYCVSGPFGGSCQASPSSTPTGALAGFYGQWSTPQGVVRCPGVLGPHPKVLSAGCYIHQDYQPGTPWSIAQFEGQHIGNIIGLGDPLTVYSPISQADFQQRLENLPLIPPQADDLLPSIPEQARKDLAEENKGPGVSVIPYTPDGQPSFEPWTSPESISTTSTQSSQEIITTTKRTTTTATPVQDGVRYDTTTTTTTETQKLDPVTGLPDGPPTTETTTETTEQSPSKPAEGEDLECGLPGTPPCKIDETGTPTEAPESIETAADDYKTSMDQLRDIVKSEDDKGMFESLRGVFLVPPIAACSPFDLPNDMGSIDPCPVVDGVREVMAYIWALTALWWCLGMIREVI